MKKGSVNQVSQTMMTQRQTDRHNGYQLLSQALPLRTLLPSKKPGKSLCRTDFPFHALPCKITASRTKSCKQLRGAVCGCAVRVPVPGSLSVRGYESCIQVHREPKSPTYKIFLCYFFLFASFLNCLPTTNPSHRDRESGSNFKKLRGP